MIIEICRRPALHFAIWPSFRERGGWQMLLIVGAWPDEEQEQGALIRALINLEINWSPRWGIRGDRYCPNRAEYWLNREGEG